MKRYISLLLCCFVFTGKCLADDAQALLDILNPIQTLKGSFTQIIVDKKGQTLQKATGEMALKKPGLFRWQIKQPIPQLIIAKNNKLWIYDPELEQLLIRSFKQEVGQTPAFLLSNLNTLRNDFTVKRLPSTSIIEWFGLTPKTNDAMFKTIAIGFMKHDLKQMRLEDNLGHKTEIQFGHLQKNIPVPDSLFQFNPPKNVDVIDETKK